MSTTAGKSELELLEEGLPSDWKKFYNHAIGAATSSYDPEGKWSPMFRFVRNLESYCYAGLRGRWSAEQIADVIEKAHECTSLRFFGEIRTSFWMDYELYGGRDEFIAVWHDMRFPPNNPLQSATDAAKQLPLKLKKPITEAYSKVISLAGHLQRQVGDHDIALPQGVVGKALNLSQPTVSVYLRMAERDGFIRKVKWAIHLKHLAAKYRFDVDRFNWKTGKQIS